MNKTELIDQIAERSGNTKAAATKMLDAFIETVGETMANGESVTLVGFGTFSTGERAARTGRNPRTGETIKIAKARTAKWTAGKQIKELVNSKKPKKK